MGAPDQGRGRLEAVEGREAQRRNRRTCPLRLFDRIILLQLRLAILATVRRLPGGDCFGTPGITFRASYSPVWS